MERRRPQVKWYHYILPNSWPYWVFISVFWLFSLLPYRVLKGMGWCLGSMLFFIPCYSRTIAKINLELCFPELDAKARRRLFLKCYQSVGFCFFETALALFASNRRVAPWVSFKNMEVLEQAEKEGVGVIVPVPHFLNLLLAGRLVTQKMPFDVLFRPHKKPVLEWIKRRCIYQHFHQAISSFDIRGMVKALRRHERVFYFYDVDIGRKNIVYAKFLGQTAATITAASRLAKLTGAKVIPVSIYRCPGSQPHYEIAFSDPLEGFPSGDDIADANRINALFEAMIRRAPEQYLWHYRRFNTQPVKSDSPYPRG